MKLWTFNHLKRLLRLSLIGIVARSIFDLYLFWSCQSDFYDLYHLQKLPKLSNKHLNRKKIPKKETIIWLMIKIYLNHYQKHQKRKRKKKWNIFLHHTRITFNTQSKFLTAFKIQSVDNFLYIFSKKFLFDKSRTW